MEYYIPSASARPSRGEGGSEGSIIRTPKPTT
jgi:hypothetical protein